VTKSTCRIWIIPARQFNQLLIFRFFNPFFAQNRKLNRFVVVWWTDLYWTTIKMINAFYCKREKMILSQCRCVHILFPLLCATFCGLCEIWISMYIYLNCKHALTCALCFWYRVSRSAMLLTYSLAIESSEK
jgi:hypothetical protein